MKSIIAPLSVLFSLGSALPAPAADPVRILPYNWSWEILSKKGPGCTDDATAGWKTRPTYGSNTVDGSELYFWHFAIPGLMASVGPGVERNSSWCELTLSYTESNVPYDSGKPLDTKTSDYRLKMHKNGTEVLATYLPLEAGATADWKFTYYPEDDDEIVDTIHVAGPVKDDRTGQMLKSQPAKKLKQYSLPKCGSGKVRFRTDLTVKSNKDGAKGVVASEFINSKPDPGYYGVQPGISYDWEKC